MRAALQWYRFGDAEPDDAVAACDVLRESMAAWAAQSGSSLLLAIEGDAVLGVGFVTDAGEIMLNYVAPAARFGGVSRALLRALEAGAVA